LLPDGINKIVSPFFDDRSVKIVYAKELNISVIGHDIFDLLVNFWNVQIKNPKELGII
jgi:DNA adenine methylase